MASNETKAETAELPVVLYYRLVFDLPQLKQLLQSHFEVIDPADSPDYNRDKPLQSVPYLDCIRALIMVGYTPVTAEFLSLLPSLELVVATSAGLNHVDLKEWKRRKITVTNASEAMADDGADYAVALLIAVLRKISAADRYVHAGLWPVNGDYPLGSKIGGKRVGIVGYGNIGCQVAERLMAFGCSIAYNSRKKKPSVPFQYYANVLDLAANSDILIVSCALTQETRHMINKDVMEALGKRGIVINIGRGGLIDEKELVEFLLQGKIGGAGLDVFEEEPNVPKELFSLDNVVLSPHRAVGTPETILAVTEVTVTNVKAYFSNTPLSSLVQID